MDIGASIRGIRREFDLTQGQLGEIAGVSSMAVSQWENGRAVPRMGAVQRISDALGIPKSRIIGDEGIYSIIPRDEYDEAILHLFACMSTAEKEVVIDYAYMLMNRWRRGPDRSKNADESTNAMRDLIREMIRKELSNEHN